MINFNRSCIGWLQDLQDNYITDNEGYEIINRVINRLDEMGI